MKKLPRQHPQAGGRPAIDSQGRSDSARAIDALASLVEHWTSKRWELETANLVKESTAKEQCSATKVNGLSSLGSESVAAALLEQATCFKQLAAQISAEQKGV